MVSHYSSIFCMFRSYSDANQKAHSSNKRYDVHIPRFLIDRPPEMIRHCLERVSRAENADLSGIIALEDGKSFRVLSFQEGSREVYEVKFGDDRSMPSCTCEDWRRSAFPCKHFFAIFKKYDDYNWECLSQPYRNSPFLTLDPQFFIEDTMMTPPPSPLPKLSTSSPLNPSRPRTPPSFESVQQCPSTSPIRIPSIDIAGSSSPTSAPCSLAYACKKLKSISELAYLVEDKPDLMRELNRGLRQLESFLSPLVTKENGLSICPGSDPKWQAAKSIPLRMRPKKQTRRFGQANEEKIKSSKVEICGEKPAEKKPKLEEDPYADQRIDEVFAILDDRKTSVNFNLLSLQYAIS